MKPARSHQLRYVLPILSIAFIVSGTYLAIQYAKGYRPTTDGLAGTGLLAANSFPNGAEVFVNDKLTTATDDTLNLPPGEYDISIKKDGFIDWYKKLTIQEELVTQTNAVLFRAVPGLSPLTLSGADNLHPSPDGQKIVFAVSNASTPAKNGLYVLELSSSSPLSSQKQATQISRQPANFEFSQAQLLWSPSSDQILVHHESETNQISNFLLESDTFNEIESLPDVTARLPIILSQWEEEIVDRETKQFALLPEDLKSIATSSAINVFFSPSDEKIMYTSTEYLSLPDDIIDEPPASSTQPEERDLEPGGIYIFDLIEDKNFRIGSISLEADKPQKTLLLLENYQQSIEPDAINTVTIPPQPLTEYTRLQDTDSFSQTLDNFKTHYSSVFVSNMQWYPDSSHVLIVEPDNIDISQYDATNRITLYSGPFENQFAYPWPDGSKLIVVTNLNPSSDLPVNLYAVDIR